MNANLISSEATEWIEFLSHLKHDFYHLPEYVRLCAEQEGGKPMAFIAEEAGNRFLLPLIKRPIDINGETIPEYFDAISPYGYPGPLLGGKGDQMPTEHFVRRTCESLAENLSRRHIISLFARFHPLFDLPLDSFNACGLTVQHGETVFIDLTLSAEDMWQQTRSGHRNEINRSKRNGFHVEMDTNWDSLPDFVDLYAETMERVNANPYYFFPRTYFDRLKADLNNVLHLATVHIDGELACAGLFAEQCGIVQYHLSGTADRYVKHYPSKLMLDFVRHWAKQRGNAVFHLGGGFGGSADSLFNFKAGFSHLRKPFFTWRVVTDDIAYAQLARQWEDMADSCTADDLNGFFPAYRKPLECLSK